MSEELIGQYWVRWGTGKPWEAFDFTGREAFIPAEIGPRILSAEELLANSEELTRLRAENVALRKFVNPRGHLEDCSIRSVGELRKRIKDDTHVPRCSCGLSALLTTPTSEAAGEPNVNELTKLCRETFAELDKLPPPTQEAIDRAAYIDEVVEFISAPAGEPAATSFTHAMPKCEVCGRPGIGCCTVEAKPCSACSGRGHRRLDSVLPGISLTCKTCNGTGKEPAAPSLRPNCIFDGGNPERCFQCHKQYQSEPLPRPCSAAPSVTTEGGK